jgi:O-antigen/teichoic acid export membrane protein
MSKIRDISIITVGRVLVMLTSIISIRLLTMWLTPSEVGRLNIVMALYGWFGLVLINPVGMYINRKVIEWNREKTAIRHLKSLGGYLAITASLSIAVVFAVTPFIGITIHKVWLMALVGGCVLLISGNASFVSYLNLLGYRVWYVVLSNFTLWIGLLVSWILVASVRGNAECWLTGQLTGNAVLMIVSIIVLFKYLGKDGPAGDTDKSFSLPTVFKFATPLAISTFFYWCHTQGYRFVYQRIAGMETMGLFVIGFGIGVSLMNAFDGLFGQYYNPVFYNDIAHSNEDERCAAWNKYASAYFPAVLVMMIFVGANGYQFAKIFTAKEYHMAGNIVIWGAIAESLRMCTSAYSMVSHAQLDMKPVIGPGITGAVIGLGGIFVLTKYDPLVGGGVALSIGWIFAMFHMQVNMKKLLPIRFPLRRILYACLLSAPFVAGLLVKNSSMAVSLVVLCVTGVYLVIAQYVLARKWLEISLPLPFVDDMENKLRSWQGYNG